MYTLEDSVDILQRIQWVYYRGQSGYTIEIEWIYTIEYRTRYFIDRQIDRGQDLYFIEKERRKINKYRKGQDIPYVKEKGRGQNILYNERQRTRYVQWFIFTEKEQKNERIELNLELS